VHDAITAFVSGGASGSMEHHDALATSISLTIAWAIGPFSVTLAWLSMGRSWLTVPLAALAAGSPRVAGWFFSWSLRSIITTAIPGLFILGFGYRPKRRGDLSHRTSVVAGMAVAWLTFALIFDLPLLDRCAVLFRVDAGPDARAVQPQRTVQRQLNSWRMMTAVLALRSLAPGATAAGARMVTDDRSELFRRLARRTTSDAATAQVIPIVIVDEERGPDPRSDSWRCFLHGETDIPTRYKVDLDRRLERTLDV
jgi:hypothetical protein